MPTRTVSQENSLLAGHVCEVVKLIFFVGFILTSMLLAAREGPRSLQETRALQASVLLLRRRSGEDGPKPKLLRRYPRVIRYPRQALIRPRWRSRSFTLSL